MCVCVCVCLFCLLLLFWCCWVVVVAVVVVVGLLLLFLLSLHNPVRLSKGCQKPTTVLPSLSEKIGQGLTPKENMTLRMDPWVTQMGYPVVMVTRTGSGQLRLSQQRFLLGSEESTDDRYKDPPYE